MRHAAGLALMWLPACGALAQSNSASIAGQVVDPAHGPVACAQIVIRNTDLGTERAVLTDAGGSFRADALV